ncbi:uncharacterized protein LOC133741785 [Rosa rugosa]|uniref:uncharacterized protein LOC133741785 n=1 Tax=Rosa rugosa TaxID=74645 RepID=UPI002B400923|nr:uncharacterized protein LOC133741785 [Rosa rugosa]
MQNNLLSPIQKQHHRLHSLTRVTTTFISVRLKKYLEMRHVDGKLAFEKLICFACIWGLNHNLDQFSVRLVEQQATKPQIFRPTFMKHFSLLCSIYSFIKLYLPSLI